MYVPTPERRELLHATGGLTCPCACLERRVGNCLALPCLVPAVCKTVPGQYIHVNLTICTV